MKQEKRRLLHQQMFMSRVFGRLVTFMVTMVLVSLSGGSLAAQSTGVCALLKPADVTPLLAGTGPAVGTEMGPMCMWSAPGSQRYLQVAFLPVDKPVNAGTIFDRARKQVENDPAFKDEPGMGDRAFSTWGLFDVLKKGRIMRVAYATMDMKLMADAHYMEQVRDAARPVAKKAADAV